MLAMIPTGLITWNVDAVVDVVALVLSGGALLFTGIDLWKQKDNPLSSPKIVLSIGALISGVAFFKSTFDVVENYYD